MGANRFATEIKPWKADDIFGLMTHLESQVGKYTRQNDGNCRLYFLGSSAIAKADSQGSASSAKKSFVQA